MSGTVLPTITHVGFQSLYGGGGGGSNIQLSSFQQLYTSSVVASSIVLDNQILTAAPAELLLNGQPLVVQSNLSSIADWAFEVALSNVDVNGNDVVNANIIDAGQFVGILGNFQEVYTSSLTASTIVCNELVALSTIQTYNYVSSYIVTANTLSSVVVNTTQVLASTFNGYTVSDFLSSSAIPSTITLSSIIFDVGSTSTVQMYGDWTDPAVPPQFNIDAPYNVNINMGIQTAQYPDYNRAGQLRVYGQMYVADPAQQVLGAIFSGSSNNDGNFTIQPTRTLIVQPNNPGTALLAQTLNGSQQSKGIRWQDQQVSPAANYAQEMWVNDGYLATNGGFTVGNNLLAGSNIQTSTINGYTISDFLSTSSSQYDPNPVFSTIVMNPTGIISTPELFVSSINGAEFTGSAGGGIQVSSLVTASISSVFGDVQFQLVSTLQFSAGSNSFSLGGLNLGLGSILGQLTGGALGIIGAATGIVGLGTGVAALTQTRGTNNINTANYELVNGLTQLQISTIPDTISTIYRFSSGNPPDQAMGAEYFISTISPPGTFIRAMSDPLNTASTPTSTIQAFGQWVPLPIPVVSTIADWAFEPALSNVDVNSFDVVNAANIQGLNGQLSTITFLPSTIITGSQYYQEFQVLRRDLPTNTGQILVNAVKYAAQPDTVGAAFGSYSYPQDRAIYINSSFSTHYVAYLDDLSTVSTFVDLNTSNINASNINVNTISTGQVMTMTGGAAIEFRVADGTGNNQGSLNVNNNGRMLLVADELQSEVAVPIVNTDFIGSKNNSVITIRNPLEQEPGYYISTQQVYANDLRANTVAGVTITSADNSSQITVGTNVMTHTVLGDILFYTPIAGSVINMNATSTCMTTDVYVGNSISTPTILASNAALRNISTVNNTVYNPTTLSSVTMTVPNTNGAQVQPAGRLFINNTVDLGSSNDLWARNLRVGAGFTGTGAEIIMYDPSNSQSFLNWNTQDKALRFSAQYKSLTTYGYLLDTTYNPPFFSTINNSVNLMSFYPSTLVSSFVSTISVLPNYIFSAYSSTSQTVLAANTATNLTHNTVTTNVGGFTNLGSTITVPVAGVYEIGTSIQFVTSSGGTNSAYFWLKKNGANVAQTNSKVSVVNNGDTIGTVTFFDTAAANDKYTIAIESSDANMQAGAIAATGDMPAVPSVITNIKRIG